MNLNKSTGMKINELAAMGTTGSYENECVYMQDLPITIYVKKQE